LVSYSSGCRPISKCVAKAAKFRFAPRVKGYYHKIRGVKMVKHLTIGKKLQSTVLMLFVTALVMFTTELTSFAGERSYTFDTGDAWELYEGAWNGANWKVENGEGYIWCPKHNAWEKLRLDCGLSIEEAIELLREEVPRHSQEVKRVRKQIEKEMSK